ncbi:MAG TPA: hypothetical protein VFS23_26545 [Vicinamibacterales bacterium]|nr:hypothetical protein [Vicinamibacterales bacterium]
MTVSLVAYWRVEPAGLTSALRDVVRAKPIIERHGGKVRVQVPIAGDEPDAYSVTVECADWAAYGAYMAALLADREWTTFQGEVLQREGPTTRLVSQTLWMDVPL